MVSNVLHNVYSYAGSYYGDAKVSRERGNTKGRPQKTVGKVDATNGSVDNHFRFIPNLNEPPQSMDTYGTRGRLKQHTDFETQLQRQQTQTPPTYRTLNLLG